jgi:hypothetical protein
VRRFDVVGYGCMTCVSNSTPVEKAISTAVEKVSGFVSRSRTLPIELCAVFITIVENTMNMFF